MAFAAKRADRLVHLQQASRLNPHDERSRIAIADVPLASGNRTRRAESLRETIRDVPESAEAHWQLGRVEQTLGNGGAVQAFERAATKPLVAGRARLYAIIGQAYHAQFDLDPSLPYRQRVPDRAQIATRTSISVRSIARRTSSTTRWSNISLLH